MPALSLTSLCVFEGPANAESGLGMKNGCGTSALIAACIFYKLLQSCMEDLFNLLPSNGKNRCYQRHTPQIQQNPRLPKVSLQPPKHPQLPSHPIITTTTTTPSILSYPDPTPNPHSHPQPHLTPHTTSQPSKPPTPSSPPPSSTSPKPRSP